MYWYISIRKQIRFELINGRKLLRNYKIILKRVLINWFLVLWNLKLFIRKIIKKLVLWW